VSGSRSNLIEKHNTSFIEDPRNTAAESGAGTISEKQMDVAIFDSPASFRHPTTWHARAYGLFAANPFSAREFTRDPNRDGSWTVPEGSSVTFRYRVLIHEGDFGPAEISSAYSKHASRN
jgi:hypothetical protein